MMNNQLSIFSTAFIVILITIIVATPETTLALSAADIAENVFNSFRDGIEELLGYVVWYGLYLPSVFFMGLAGAIFEFISAYTVVGMGELFKSGSDGSNGNILAGVFSESIPSIWRTVRDICNMAFIFVLLYTGIMTIISSGQRANYQRTLINLVVAAVFINFSLFFTQVIVDYSNYFATLFYDAVVTAEHSDNTLTTAILRPIGLQTSISTSDSALAQNGMNTAFAGLIGAVVNLIMMSVMIIMSLFLMVRFIVLVIVMIASPIFFVALMLPRFENVRKKLWGTLIGYAAMAPIFFVCIYIAAVIGNAQKNSGANATILNFMEDSSASGDFNGLFSAQYGSLWFTIIMMVALLLFAIIAAQKVASASPAFVNRGLSRIQRGVNGAFLRTPARLAGRGAGAATFGAASKIGRETVGRGATAIARSEKLRDFEANGGFFTKRLARSALASSTKIADQSFDARAPLNAGIAGLTGKENVLGKAVDGGYAKVKEEKAKQKAEWLSKYTQPDETKVKELEAKFGEADKPYQDTRNAYVAYDKIDKISQDVGQKKETLINAAAKSFADVRSSATLTNAEKSTLDNHITERRRKAYELANKAQVVSQKQQELSQEKDKKKRAQLEQEVNAGNGEIVDLQDSIRQINQQFETTLSGSGANQSEKDNLRHSFGRVDDTARDYSTEKSALGTQNAKAEKLMKDQKVSFDQSGRDELFNKTKELAVEREKRQHELLRYTDTDQKAKERALEKHIKQKFGEDITKDDLNDRELKAARKEVARLGLAERERVQNVHEARLNAIAEYSEMNIFSKLTRTKTDGAITAGIGMTVGGIMGAFAPAVSAGGGAALGYLAAPATVLTAKGVKKAQKSDGLVGKTANFMRSSTNQMAAQKLREKARSVKSGKDSKKNTDNKTKDDKNKGSGSKNNKNSKK